MSEKLLVIGNGFDLSVGAETSYSSYFCSDSFKGSKEAAIKWIKSCAFGEAFITDEKESFNCWDLLFCMKSCHIPGVKMNNEKIDDWCDVEKVIHDSLTSDSRKNFSWKFVYDNLHKTYDNSEYTKHFCNASSDVDIMCRYLFGKKWENKCKNLSIFYKALLEELNSFERSFGRYINEVTNSEEFVSKAIRIAKQLINDTDGTNEIMIDSFNYSDFSNDHVSIRHINGNCDNPIFGIDLKENKEGSTQRISCFTKTSRRLLQDAHNLSKRCEDRSDTITSAVVFGHSLNEMDYDYFYYLFTMLKFHTFDINKMGRIEFVYKLHGKEPDKVRSELSERVYELLNYYENYVSKSNQHILINLLRFSGKLSIRELS